MMAPMTHPEIGGSPGPSRSRRGPMTWLGTAAGAAALLALAIGACGRPRPSSVPLGGDEEPSHQAPHGSTTTETDAPAIADEEEGEHTALVDEAESNAQGEPGDDRESPEPDEGAEAEAQLASAAPAADVPTCDDST